MEVDDLITCEICNSKILKKCQAIHNVACKSYKNNEHK